MSLRTVVSTVSLLDRNDNQVSKTVDRSQTHKRLIAKLLINYEISVVHVSSNLSDSVINMLSV